MLLSDLERHAQLAELSEKFGCPWLEYDEKIAAPMLLQLRLDFKALRRELWFPVSVENDQAKVIAVAPGPELAQHVKVVFGVSQVDFFVTLAEDLVRIIEHNQDINPGFPASAGRTPLARVRTYLAGRRSLLAHYRTLLAKSRTGLAFIRTGISFITIALLFLRIFGAGYLLFLEVPLLAVGCVMSYDGFKWYLAARNIHDHTAIHWHETNPTGGSTILEVHGVEVAPEYRRSPEVDGALELRQRWMSLSPVMRRRYLANDRTDLVEERTKLACFRTQMAKTRTGLAFVRTGFAFFGLGSALVRRYHASGWLALDVTLMLIGIWMAWEGFLSYSSGRRAGEVGYAAAKVQKLSIWDFSFPHSHTSISPMRHSVPLPVRNGHAPGIWATTGLALERTVLAERRNVMARLRTVMARGRTGYALIRTGLSIVMVGVAFIFTFYGGSLGWTLFEGLIVLGGMVLVVDGLYLNLPAERYRRQFPYCTGDMDIGVPDYGKPVRVWGKVVFSNDPS